ncbi:HAMP domain-containing sensor histidine kinase [Paenibacillus sp. FSL W8-0187]|uniref:HAMP domain-containing sensor histidine kinase n=1 Tax=Paenibacillus sp. FSL W8-0187 TaxID=2921710 RepID=UPI0030DC831B
MKSKWMYLTMVAVFMAGLLVFVRMMATGVDTDVDIVMVNKVLKTVENHWEHVDQGDYSGITQRFVVLDQKGAVRYETSDGLFTNVYDAIKNRGIVLDVKVEGKFVGKLILFDDYEQRVQRSKKHLVVVLLTIFAVLALLCTLYIIMLNRLVIRPFKKLQSFALNVARGNLDVPLSMDRSNLFGAFTESFDIMREQLATARQREYEANRSKKELVASLSHDVKTPVASIKAVSELMLLRVDDEKLIRQLNMIHSKAEQINGLVTDMFQATLEELQELKVNVTEEYSSVLNTIIANVNLDNRITFDAIPKCLILIDVTRLQQVFDNILSNSYKYAGTDVRISSYITSIYLHIEITDFGKGVEEDELPLLFNKFYRGRNASGQTGAGLGLYITKYLMQSMDGDVSCHNRDNGFTVKLQIKLV